jgi:hypothetical protein
MSNESMTEKTGTTQPGEPPTQKSTSLQTTTSLRKRMDRNNIRYRERYRTDPEFRARALAKSRKYWAENHSFRKRRVSKRAELRADKPDDKAEKASKAMVERARRHRISPQDLELLLSAHSKCENPNCDNTEKLHVDHCHSTGGIRGVLCSGCNSALGYLKDNPQRIAGLVEYITARARDSAEPQATSCT